MSGLAYNFAEAPISPIITEHAMVSLAILLCARLFGICSPHSKLSTTAGRGGYATKLAWSQITGPPKKHRTWVTATTQTAPAEEPFQFSVGGDSWPRRASLSHSFAAIDRYSAAGVNAVQDSGCFRLRTPIFDRRHQFAGGNGVTSRCAATLTARMTDRLAAMAFLSSAPPPPRSDTFLIRCGRLSTTMSRPRILLPVYPAMMNWGFPAAVWRPILSCTVR